MASPRAPLTLKLDRRGDSVRIRVAGDLAFGTAHRLDHMLDRLGDLRGQTLVLDLELTQFVDSSGLAALVATKLRSDREGFALELANATQPVRRMLERTGLDRILRSTPAP
jgi:anti-anti-sigma factor